MIIQDIAYRDYKKSSDIHGTVLYPAVMVAPIQKGILRMLIDPNEPISVFDPFHGSGTALYECMELSKKAHLYGCDINPLANLITKAKLGGVSSRINKDIRTLSNLILDENVAQPLQFESIDKWFRTDVQIELSRIRNAIIKIPNKRNRLFFWSMLSDVIRKHSNTRSSTYKLHIKPLSKIETMDTKVINSYMRSITENAPKYAANTSKFTLYKCDILSKILEFNNNKFDIVISSPPYGENGTTVPYGQFSALPLRWIDKNDLDLEGWELANFSSIDTNSMGGQARALHMNSYAMTLLMPYLKKISSDKQRKVIRFFNDYFFFLDQLCRVTKKYIVLTLGNRTVDRVNINLTDISKLYLESNGFKNEQVLERDIPVKRTPKKTSKVGDLPVTSINSEYVIIHKRAI